MPPRRATTGRGERILRRCHTWRRWHSAPPLQCINPRRQTRDVLAQRIRRSLKPGHAGLQLRVRRTRGRTLLGCWLAIHSVRCHRSRGIVPQSPLPSHRPQACGLVILIPIRTAAKDLLDQRYLSSRPIPGSPRPAGRSNPANRDADPAKYPPPSSADRR